MQQKLVSSWQYFTPDKIPSLNTFHSLFFSFRITGWNSETENRSGKGNGVSILSGVVTLNSLIFAAIITRININTLIDSVI